MGFNLFAIEASEPDAIAVDDYVMTGKGDPATAPPQPRLLDLEHRGSARHDQVDAEVERGSVAGGEGALLRIRHAESPCLRVTC
ncbi:MAG TPA: erythromycin esterase family protein [Thermoanaerobaculia bacterium]|nr:erythromycin esterase family protein [Thermoanaerobaculia bacterium]